MKKIFALFVYTIIFVSPAFAKKDDPPAPPPAVEVNFATAYTVLGIGSETQQTSFTLAETPFLYFQLPNPGTASWDAALDTSKLKSKWNLLGSANHAINHNVDGNDTQTFSTGDKYWVSLDDWTSLKATGNWEIKDIKYEFLDDSLKLQKGDFTGSNLAFTVTSVPVVTPEPASMALFSLGAGLLGLKRARRKQN